MSIESLLKEVNLDVADDSMLLWNITFTAENQEELYNALNNFYPGYYIVGRSAKQYHTGLTTMVALTEEEAVIIRLTTGATIERLEK